jgi:RNA ligase (TIGR02306 family)
MSDWNPQIVKIEKLIAHPNADTLDVATVLGDYPVIVKRDEYKVGDIAGYLPLDTIVPDTEQFYFLCPKSYEQYEENGEVKSRQIGTKYSLGSVPEKYRIIKAKRIRGIFSMGMLVLVPQETCLGTSNVGMSIIDYLDLKKYEEPEEEDNIVPIKMRGANAESPPKGWVIPHYDIDGLRKYLSCLQDGEEIVLTEKLNGSNAAFCHDGERLWCKSRNWFKKFDETDPWWDIAIRYKLEEKLAKYPNIVLFGELVGNVKGFRYTAEIIGGKLHTKIYFFDALDTKNKKYLDYDDLLSITKDLELETTPELYRGVWKGKAEMYPYAEGMSALNPKHIREGFVVKTAKERYEPRLDNRLILKLIGEGYNLQK